MDRIRGLFSSRASNKDVPAEYEPLRRTSGDDVVDRPEDDVPRAEVPMTAEVPFSWFEYIIFALVGVAMLWAW